MSRFEKKVRLHLSYDCNLNMHTLDSNNDSKEVSSNKLLTKKDGKIQRILLIVTKTIYVNVNVKKNKK